MFKLVAPFSPCGDQPHAIEQLAANFQAGKTHQTLLGVTGSGKTFTMAHLIERLGKKTLVLAHNKTLAAQLYAEFKEFFPQNAVEYFVSYYDYYRPEAYVANTDTYIEKDSSVNEEIDKLRHSATRSLVERKDVIIVASVSCIYGIGGPEEYSDQRITLFAGDTLERDEFIRRLIAIQYKRNDIDFSRGHVRVRGDTVDVFPVHEDAAVVRIEFFGDQVEALTLMDPLRNTLLKTLGKVTIYPQSHYVVGQRRLKAAIKSIKEELRQRLAWLKKRQKLVEHQRLQQRTALDLEMLEEMGFCQGIENYSRHLSQSPAGCPPPTLLDFFKRDFLMIIDESHMSVPQIGGMYQGDRNRKENLVEHGFRLPSALDNRPLRFAEFEGKLDQTLFVSATPAEYELKKSGGEFVQQIIRPTGLLDPVLEVKSAKNQVDDFLIECKRTIKEGHRVLITTLTKKLAERLSVFYQAAGLKVRYLHSDINAIERIEIIRDLRQGIFHVLVGINLLREGLDIPEVALVGIMDADKEGFLRSERSLIQTIGRAARHVHGRVILYGHKRTAAMERAIQETNRRRKLQHPHNQKHGILPQGVSKKIAGGVIETLRGSKSGKGAAKRRKSLVTELSAESIDEQIGHLKKEMTLLARELKFEEAARLRDQIKELNEARLIL